MRPKQHALAASGFECHCKPTRRDQFLTEMNVVVPGEKLNALIEPIYPKGDGPGRPPVGLERMLRIHFLQHWFNLSDPSMAPPAGVEPTTYRLGGGRSIH